jgi:hypothetical protein
MSPLINAVILGCVLLYTGLLLADGIRGQFSHAVGLEVGLVLLILIVLHFATGFPVPSERTAFGATGLSSLTAIGVMFVCVVFGIAARYVFFLKGPLNWIALLKPLCVSPIILLPLIGSLQSNAAIEPIQAISLAILAFQNGFFWNVILERTKPK